MSVVPPQLGSVNCSRAIALLEHYPENIVGSFWIMADDNTLEMRNLPDWWLNIISSQENSAQAILDGFKEGKFKGQHNNPLYYGICIIVVGSKENPAAFSYLVQEVRMDEDEGIGLLRSMVKSNIPALPVETLSPAVFLSARFDTRTKTYSFLHQNISRWSIYVWEDYCSYLLGSNGKKMLTNYWRKQ
jgi:hypothetical protein